MVRRQLYLLLIEEEYTELPGLSVNLFPFLFCVVFLYVFIHWIIQTYTDLHISYFLEINPVLKATSARLYPFLYIIDTTKKQHKAVYWMWSACLNKNRILFSSHKFTCIICFWSLVFYMFVLINVIYLSCWMLFDRFLKYTLYIVYIFQLIVFNVSKLFFLYNYGRVASYHISDIVWACLHEIWVSLFLMAYHVHHCMFTG